MRVAPSGRCETSSSVHDSHPGPPLLHARRLYGPDLIGYKDSEGMYDGGASVAQARIDEVNKAYAKLGTGVQFYIQVCAQWWCAVVVRGGMR